MSANSVAEKMRAQRIEHEQRMTLHQYICSRIPEEAHRDPVVRAVLDLHMRKPETSLEACLFDMVRELCQNRKELLRQSIALMAGKDEKDARGLLGK